MTVRFFYLMVMLVGTLTMNALAQTQPRQKVAEGYYLLTPQEVAAKLVSTQNFLLINTNARYEGEIRHTDIFIPFDAISSYYAILPKDRNADIVVYATLEELARLAAKNLIALGFTEVKVLAGGLGAWEQAGFERYSAFASIPRTASSRLEAVSRHMGIASERFVEVDIHGDATLGLHSAPLVLIEFSDMNCPYCQSFHQDTFEQIVENYLNSGQLRYVYKDYIGVGGEVSQDTAETAECLREQIADEHYFEVLNQLYHYPNSKTREALLSLTNISDASSLALCQATRRYQAEVQEDTLTGQRLGIRGTPGFVLGVLQEDGSVKGVVIQGALPFASFRTYITGFLEASY